MHNVDSVIRRQLAIGVAEAFKCAEAAEIEVGKETGVVGPGRFYQHDIQRALAILCQIAGDGGTACTAANHDDAGAGLGHDHGGGECGCQRG